MAYVSVSRAQFDVQMYTNDAGTLGQQLSRDVSNPSAIQQQTPIQQDAAQKIEAPPELVQQQDISQGHGQGLSL